MKKKKKNRQYGERNTKGKTLKMTSMEKREREGKEEKGMGIS